MKGNFDNIIKSGPLVLVDFYADWCGPCTMQAPILIEISKELKGSVRIIKIDVDKNQTISGRYKIRNIPTLMLFKNGKDIWRKGGVSAKEELIRLIKLNQ
ncbi:MAG: thioredoxin 1 [Parvicellaceae bacterium]|jgi:thioredoxin 1